MTSAEYRALYAALPNPSPPRPRKPALHTSTANPAPEPTRATYATISGTVAPPEPPGFGVIAVEGFTGARFVAVGCPPPLVEALADVCRQHGARALATNHFLVESVPGSGPKVKVKSSE